MQNICKLQKYKLQSAGIRSDILCSYILLHLQSVCLKAKELITDILSRRKHFSANLSKMNHLIQSSTLHIKNSSKHFRCINPHVLISYALICMKFSLNIINSMEIDANDFKATSKMIARLAILELYNKSKIIINSYGKISCLPLC